MNKSEQFFNDSENYWQKKADIFARLYATKNPLQIPNRVFLNQRMEIVTKHIPHLPEGTAVDVGCGSGELVGKLSQHFGKVIGIDYSQIMLDIAKKEVQAKNAEFILSDSAKLPLKDAQADALFALGLLDYVKDVETTMREFSRVLKPGAQAIFTAPKSPSLFAPLRWFSHLRTAVFGIPPIVHALSRKDLESMLERCGLKPVMMTSLWTTMWICCVQKKSTQ